MANLNNLPLELYQEIFEYHNLNDLANFKILNKRFNFIISKFRIKELCFKNKYEKERSIWRLINKTVNHNYIVHRSKSFILNESIFNFQYLKWLRINLVQKSSFSLCVIIELKQLEYLEINLKLKDKSSVLALPNLKYLDLNVCREVNQFLKVNTPLLEALRFSGQLHFIKFTHPLSIKQLHITYFNDELAIFKNLESIVLNNASLKLDTNLLSSFIDLKSIFIYNVNLCNHLLEYKSIQSNDQAIQIYLNNIQVLNSNNTNYCQNLQNYMKNYHLLSNGLAEFKAIYYNQLMNLVYDAIPVGFFKKFFNIQSIHVQDRVKDEDQLIKFISQCENLNSLKLTNPSLAKSFYNRIPSISALFKLDISENTKKGLNFNFIFRMFHLQYFITNQQLSNSNIIKNLNNLTHLKKMNFKIKEVSISINVIKSGRYYVYKNNRRINQSFNLDELIKQLDEFRKPPEMTRLKRKKN